MNSFAMDRERAGSSVLIVKLSSTSNRHCRHKGESTVTKFLIANFTEFIDANQILEQCISLGWKLKDVLYPSRLFGQGESQSVH
jgi:hypothetical protein